MTVTGETASGWQYATLATPVPTTVPNDYVVSVNSNTQYGYTSSGLSILNNALMGQLGLWGTTPGVFPNNINNCNYFRDIVFTAAAPTISSFTPASGGTGTVVTITGANFTGTTAVSFGSTPAGWFTVNSDTSISADAGNNATGAISVTKPGGTATTSSSFNPLPTISSFTPTSGGAGTVVTITGTNFTGATAVKFGLIGGDIVYREQQHFDQRYRGQQRHRHHQRHHRRGHGHQYRHLQPAAHHHFVHSEQRKRRHGHSGEH